MFSEDQPLVEPSFQPPPGPLVVVGAGEVFVKKIRPQLEKLGLSQFLIYDPAYEGPGHLDRLEAAPADRPALILSPNYCHYEQALFFLGRNQPFYLEKPLVVSLGELAGLREALAERPEATVYFGDYYIFKAWPLISFFRGRAEGPFLAAAGVRPEFGPVVRVAGCLHEKMVLSHRAWLSRTAEGGGMLLDLMVHLTTILKILGWTVTGLSAVRLEGYESEGGFQPLSDPGRGEDRAVLAGWLNETVPFRLAVSKYAAVQDRWLRFEDDKGRIVQLVFGPDRNYLEVSEKGAEPSFRLELTVDPYWLTLREAGSFLGAGPAGGRKYFAVQAESMALAERGRQVYWASRE